MHTKRIFCTELVPMKLHCLHWVADPYRLQINFTLKSQSQKTSAEAYQTVHHFKQLLSSLPITLRASNCTSNPIKSVFIMKAITGRPTKFILKLNLQMLPLHDANFRLVLTSVIVTMLLIHVSWFGLCKAFYKNECALSSWCKSGALCSTALFTPSLWDICGFNSIMRLVLPCIWWEMGLLKYLSSVSHLNLVVI